MSGRRARAVVADRMHDARLDVVLCGRVPTARDALAWYRIFGRIDRTSAVDHDRRWSPRPGAAALAISRRRARERREDRETVRRIRRKLGRKGARRLGQQLTERAAKKGEAA